MKDGRVAGSSRWLRLGAAVVVIAVVAVVGGLVSRSWWGSGADSGSRYVLKVDAKDAIIGFDPTVNARDEVGRINAAARQDTGALRTFALEQLGSTDPNIRWAALYALSLVIEEDDGEGVAALMLSLGSGNLDERLAAASGLVAVGEKAAVPVLISLLESSETTRYIVLPSWRVARGLLLTHVQQDLGLRNAASGPSAAAAKPAWQTWWAQHESSLDWDASTETFR
jgi:hypothetical protein